MTGAVGYAMARPWAKIWLAVSSKSWRQLPYPAGTASVHAVGNDSDRVLLIGAGITVGYGVLSHDLALGGHLARYISLLTGRGTDVDVVADPHITAPTLLTTLEKLAVSRYDAIVITVGGTESMQLMPRRIWCRHVGALFDEIIDRTPSSLQVFIVAVPPISVSFGLPAVMCSRVRRRTELLNDATRAMAALRPRVTFVEFAPSGIDAVERYGRATYDQWAALIAPVMKASLDHQAPTLLEAVDEDARQRSLDNLGVVGSVDRLEQIAAIARDLFAASGASINFLDHQLQRTIAAVGLPREDSPRLDSFCNITIESGALFVVEDTLADDRFCANPWVIGPEALRFYAGYPIESRDGQLIGTLCVVDTSPRTFTSSDEVLLRDLALRVQSILWLEATAR